MLTSALLLMFAAADVQPAFTWADTPRSIQLVSLPREAPPYKGWSVAQMRREYARLDDLRPGALVPAISLMAGLTGIAVSLFAYGIALGNFRGADTVANIAFGLGGTASCAFTAFGIIQLARGADDRKVYGAELETLQRLADGQERDERLLDMWEQRYGPRTPPPMLGPPPVGPVPPPSAPPIVPGPPIFPGGVSMVFPVVSGRF